MDVISSIVIYATVGFIWNFYAEKKLSSDIEKHIKIEIDKNSILDRKVKFIDIRPGFKVKN